MELESERIRLRDLAETDLPSFAELLSDSEYRRFLGTSDRDSPADVLRSHQTSVQESGLGMLSVADRASDELVGVGGIISSLVEDGSGHEALVALLDRHRGIGLGTEVAGLLVLYAFRDLGLEEVFAVVEGRNIASKRLVERFGMQYVRNRRYPHGSSPEAIYRIDRKQIDRF